MLSVFFDVIHESMTWLLILTVIGFHHNEVANAMLYSILAHFGISLF